MNASLEQTIQRRLFRYSLQNTVARLLPMSRVANVCMREFSYSNIANRVPLHKVRVPVYFNPEFSSAFFGGLQACGSLWICPVCADKITERRKREVASAITQHLGAGGELVMITRTMPHYISDSLAVHLKNFLAAEDFLKKQTAYSKLVKSLGLLGNIRVLEVTYSENGWNVHSHDLLFFERDHPYLYRHLTGLAFDECIRRYEVVSKTGLYSQWSNAVAKVTSRSSSPNAFGVNNGDFAAAYVAKWGYEPKDSWSADAELTKSHLKTNEKTHKGLTPFDLLRRFHLNNNVSMGKKFIEFSKAFFRKHQLQFSRSLKKHFNIGLKSDLVLAAESLENSVLVGNLTHDHWHNLLKFDKQINARAHFLNLVSRSGSFSSAIDFVCSLN